MGENKRSGEISLSDLFKVFVHYKKLIVGLPILGAILATFFSFVILRPTWEASAVLEIGKIGQISQASQSNQSSQVLVEPASNVVTRILLPSFAKGAINRSGAESDELYALKEFYKTIKVTQIKGSELIEIKLRGPSAEKTNDLIQSVIANLQKTHTEMMAVSIERNKKQLQILSDDIDKVSLETEFLKRKLLTTHNWNAFDATLSATLLKDKSGDLRDMIQRRLNLEEQISPSRSYTTRVVDEVYISEGPVSPNIVLIIGITVILGLFIAMVISLTHNAITSNTST